MQLPKSRRHINNNKNNNLIMIDKPHAGTSAPPRRAWVAMGTVGLLVSLLVVSLDYTISRRQTDYLIMESHLSYLNSISNNSISNSSSNNSSNNHVKDEQQETKGRVSAAAAAAAAVVVEAEENHKIISHHQVDCSSQVTSTPVQVVRTSTSPSFSMSIHDPKMDLGVSAPIAQHGCWECPHIQLVQEALRKHNNNHKPWFLDIGANIGMWSLAMAAAGFDVYAVEPFPDNWRRLCESVNLNRNDHKMHSRLNVWPISVSSQPQDLKFTLPAKDNWGSVTAAHNNNNNVADKNVVTVKALPLNTILQDLPMERPVAMKIDVEGLEMDVIQGGLDHFFPQAKIIFLAIELRVGLVQGHWTTIEKLNQIMASKGLKPYRHYEGKNDELNPASPQGWQAVKHPNVRYFDVMWM